MKTRHLISEHKVRLPEKGMADLLGLDLHQYHKLKHSPLSYFQNECGEITEFYMLVSETNDAHLLNKLKVSKDNFLRFKPEEVIALYMNHF